MNILDVRLKLSTLRCHRDGETFSAEPYLWTVFFKIDGDTAAISSNFILEGTATIIGTLGNHGNLTSRGVDDGENTSVPAGLGEFNTQLKPIPFQKPIQGLNGVGGAIGMVVVLLEEDQTKNSDIAAGHRALDMAVRKELNTLIPTLEFGHQEPTAAEIRTMKTRIGESVAKALENNVGAWDWLAGLGDMDDKIGSALFYFSHAELEEQVGGELEFAKRFRRSGDWEISGYATSAIVDQSLGRLQVSISGIPNTVVISPVHISGPGISKSLNRSTTLMDLRPGSYTITANEFRTGHLGGSSCRIHRPIDNTKSIAVTANHSARCSIVYVSEPCNL
jgi:hypothetical protein